MISERTCGINMEAKILIEEAIQKHQAAGVKIDTGCYGVILNPQNIYQVSGDNWNSCCGLGCYLIGKENQDLLRDLMAIVLNSNQEQKNKRNYI